MELGKRSKRKAMEITGVAVKGGQEVEGETEGKTE